MATLEEVYDAQARNKRFTHYDLGTVLVPFEHLRMLRRTFLEQRAAITTDRKLTNEGKTSALDQARASTRKAMEEWDEARRKNIDATLLN